MDLIDLKIIAGDIVTRSELTKPAKLQLLEWLQNEATEGQIKAFLLDGAIVHLDEQAEEIVNTRFNVSEAGGRVAKLRKSYMSMAGAGGGMNPMWLAYRKVRSMFDDCTRKCGTFEINTSRRQHCMAKCKVVKFESMLAAAKKAKNDKEVQKISAQLQNAKATLLKSKSSFKSRGAEE